MVLQRRCELLLPDVLEPERAEERQAEQRQRDERDEHPQRCRAGTVEDVVLVETVDPEADSGADSAGQA